jgi:hypothetical protein
MAKSERVFLRGMTSEHYGPAFFTCLFMGRTAA